MEIREVHRGRRKARIHVDSFLPDPLLLPMPSRDGRPLIPSVATHV